MDMASMGGAGAGAGLDPAILFGFPESNRRKGEF